MSASLPPSDDQLKKQPFPEFEKTVTDFFLKRGVADNWVIGRGFMLRPPFTLSFTEGPIKHSFKLVGSDERGVSRGTMIAAHRAVTGRFRPQITFVTIDEGAPTFRRLVPLRGLHADLISGVEPGTSITKAEFDQLTAKVRRGGDEPMTDGPRRWRELRTEYGFDVSSEGLYSRGVEPAPIFEPQPRPDMSRLVKQMLNVLLPSKPSEATSLFETEEETVPVCNKCGRLISFHKDIGGFPGVIDYRRPVLFGGSDERENLQLFCQQCNNLKAHICNRCPLFYHCERCTWAFPEQFHDTLVVSLETTEATDLELLADQENIRVDVYAKRVLLEHIESKKIT